MMRFWPGETVRVRVNFTDDSKAALAVSGVQILARSPAGGAPIVGTVVPIEDEVGVFEADFGTPVSGRWAVRATCASPTAAAVEIEFIVAPSLVI